MLPFWSGAFFVCSRTSERTRTYNVRTFVHKTLERTCTMLYNIRMRSKRDSKKNWHGWLDAKIYAEVAKMAEEKGIPVNRMIEEILRNAVEGR